PDIKLARFGVGGGMDGFVVRLDPTGSSRPVGVRIGGAGENTLTAISVDATDDIYAVGSTGSQTFPLKGAHPRHVGNAFVVKLSGARFADPHDGVTWSRTIGGRGDDAFLAVSAGIPGSIFVSGRSGSTDFPTTSGALYRRLEAQNDSVLVRLRASDGNLEFAT